MTKVRVKSHKWKRGKSGTHPGYWRKKRTKGKIHTTDKKPVKLYVVRDKKTGFIMGYKPKKYEVTSSND